MEILGIIKHIGQDIQVSASFKKRELVVTTDEQYPQHILIEFSQDKCEYLDGYKHGENVKVSINLRGREWVNPQGETKYFNGIQGWKIERVSGEQKPAAQAPAVAEPPPYATDGEEESDLPF